MPISTANFLGRYAIAQNNYFEEEAIRLAKPVSNRKIKSLRKRLTLGRGPFAPRLDTATEKLIGMTDGAHENLISANTVFPFVLFPDTISVDRQKLTITHRSFFQTSSTISVQIDDVQLAKVDVGPFFGSVHLASKFFVDNIQSINFLSRGDALAIQRLLQGYMIAHHRQIDCSSIDNAQLVVLLNELGQSSGS